MNQNPSGRRIFWIILIILFLGFFSTQYYENERNQLYGTTLITSGNGPLIHIDETNATQDWDNCPWVNGSGTMSDPYILKNLIIDAGGIDSPILIEHARKYFKIINCTLSGAEGDYYPENFGGIELYNCTNGLIQNVTSHYNTGNGLFVEISSNITIIESNFSQNQDHGMLFYYSDNITIHNNTFFNGGYNGVDVWDSDNITISSNYFFNHDNTAIDLASSRNLTVVDNFVNITGWNGIHSRIDSSTNITNNTILNAEWTGIYLEQDEYTHVNKNELINCRDGMDVVNCPSANFITDNIINTTFYLGIRIFNSYNTEIASNSLYDAFLRFHTDLPYILSTNVSSDNLVNGRPLRYYKEQDWVTPPGNTGQLIAVQCNYINLTGFPYPNFGVGLYYSNHSLINGSNLMELEIEYSKNATVTNNTGFCQGIYLRYVSGSLIQANNCSNNVAGYDRGIGIKIYYGDNNLITQNNCSDNNYGGIWLQYGNNNTISWNQCHENIGSGLYDGKGIAVSGLVEWGTNYIQNNFCFRNKMGLRVDSSYTVVRDNTLNYNLKHALYSGGGGLTSPLINNTCMFNEEYAIQGSNDYGVIINNTCGSNTYHGIVLTGDYVTLEGNNCSDNHDTGIKIGTGAPNCYAINNYMKSNWDYGLYVQNSPNCILVNNTCIGNYYDNIYVDSNSDGTDVIGNNCTAAVGSDSGIRVVYADNCIIANNTCFENGKAGIYVYYSNSCLIYGNNCSNQGNYGIYLDNSNYCSIFMNNCSYNTLYGIYVVTSIGCEIYLNFGLGNGVNDLIAGGNDNYDNFWGVGPFAWFTVNSTNILTGQYVQVTDRSFNGTEGVGPFTYQYNFSDGSSNSTFQNPLHQFTVAGNYTIILTINDTLGNPSLYMKDITVTDDSFPFAEFSANQTTIFQNGYILFTDLTLGGNFPLTYQWNFGDGSPNTTIQNPIHQYLNLGEFIVLLTVSDLNGDVSIFSTNIKVIEDLFPIALFSVNSSTIWETEFVQFTDLSSGGNGYLSYQWDFNDSSPISNLQNPVHQYNETGTYNVILTVQDLDDDFDSYAMEIIVYSPMDVPEIDMEQNYIEFEYGQTAYLNITIIDTSTNDAYYEIFRNGSVIANDTWTSGDEIIYSLDYTLPGYQNFTIIAYDGTGLHSLDIIWVHITNQNPEIIITFNGYDIKSTGNVLTVCITDISFHEQYCSLSRNGIELFTQYWISGKYFDINIDGLKKGTYIFDVTAYDGIGGVSSEIIIITVGKKIRIDILIPLIIVPCTLAALGFTYIYKRYFKKPL